MTFKNEIYNIFIGGGVDGRDKEVPAYTCGHCTTVVVLNPARIRPRTMCTSCGRWLCEQNELCQIACTPMHEMARDHMEAPKHFKRLVEPIMKGMTRKEEAVKAGFLI